MKYCANEKKHTHTEPVTVVGKLQGGAVLMCSLWIILVTNLCIYLEAKHQQNLYISSKSRVKVTLLRISVLSVFIIRKGLFLAYFT